MRDILNVMHLDFVTSRQMGLPVWILVFILCSLLGALIAPMTASFSVFAALTFIIPLQGIADKSDMKKLYGILPVERKNIIRGRFAYLFTVLFLAELCALSMVILAMQLRLFQYLPNQGTSSMLMVAETFDPASFLNYGTVIGIFTVTGVFFSYMQMMSQIFGQESEMKIIMISLVVVTAVGVGLSILSEHDLVPVISLEKLVPQTWGAKIAVSAGCNVLVLVLHVIFGEITASRLVQREL